METHTKKNKILRTLLRVINKIAKKTIYNLKKSDRDNNSSGTICENFIFDRRLVENWSRDSEQNNDEEKAMPLD